MKIFYILLILLITSCASYNDTYLDDFDNIETSSGYSDEGDSLYSEVNGVDSFYSGDDPVITNDETQLPNFMSENNNQESVILPKKSKIVYGDTKVLVNDYVDNKKLETNNGLLVYSVPDEVKVGIFFTVKVRISKNKNKQKIVFGDRGISIYEPDINSTVSIEMIDIKPVMSSSLLGDSDKFKITSLSSEFQDIDSVGYTEWTWKVTPLKGGKNYLKLLVKYKSNNDDSFKDITIFDKRILVSPNIKYSVKNWLSEYWQWLLTTLFIPLFKFILVKRRKKETT